MTGYPDIGFVPMGAGLHSPTGTPLDLVDGSTNRVVRRDQRRPVGRAEDDDIPTPDAIV